MTINNDFKKLLEQIDVMELDEKVQVLNQLRRDIHEVSPFKSEPVDCIVWVKNENVGANDYNPNSVAPPEMELLEHSIAQDGYTQPIVSWIKEEEDGEEQIEVVDGFHRSRVGKESALVKERVHGYVPITVINDTQLGKGDRMASTIRHNRARGKHKVDSMAEIVLELKRRNWNDKKIGKELGMDPDEVLRLVQIQGLAEMFQDNEFTEAWEVELNSGYDDESFEVIDDEV